MTERLGQALKNLKNNGVRMTPQRHAILSYLVHSMGHPTADEIYQFLAEDYPHMSVATVYNNLRLFKEAGLVTELTYGDASSRFDANMTDHYHAICKNCDQIVDFEYPLLEQVESAASEKTGFVIESHRLEVYGLCETCHTKLVTSH